MSAKGKRIRYLASGGDPMAERVTDMLCLMRDGTRFTRASELCSVFDEGFILALVKIAGRLPEPHELPPVVEYSDPNAFDEDDSALNVWAKNLPLSHIKLPD